MTAQRNFGALCLTIVLTVASLAGVLATPVEAAGYTRLNGSGATQTIQLGVNKSMVVELPRPAGDVLVSNPEVADAVLRTSQRLYLIGVKTGQASVFVFDAAGEQIGSLDIYVESDLSALNQLLAEAIVDGVVRAEALNGNIVLRGEVPSASASSRAQEITVGMLQGSSLGSSADGGGSVEKRVVNLLTITGEEQVTLKVTIAEVQREVVKQLGINLAGVLNSGGFSLGTLATGLSPIPFPPGLGGVGFDYTSGGDTVQATLEALEETSMLRTLAEPTLAAVSGETAAFLAGGEYPFVTGIDPDTGTRSVQFKPFGVQLAFTPVVLSAGRISLKVRTEVSEIASTEDGIPSLNTRRAESTVELPSGGAFVIAGLVQENTRRAATGFPGLQKLPILGALFSSKDFLNRETELVMIITPYLVKPTSPQQLARPDENLVMATDAESYFLGRLTKIYGTASQPAGGYAGQIGFSFD